MKKLFMFFSLIISSFFLFGEEVKAYEFEITYDDYSLVESEGFKTVLNTAKDIAEKNNFSYYFIFQNVKSLEYYVLFSNSSNYPKLYFSSGGYYYLECAYLNLRRYDSSGYQLSAGNMSSSALLRIFEIFREDRTISNNYDYLYSNKDIPFTYYHDLVINYPDITYTFNSEVSNVVLPSLYNVYLASLNTELPDIHKEEKEVLLNFYTICIDKIGYLSSQISSNYIYLSMIVIFIFIFVIELIRRYLL